MNDFVNKGFLLIFVLASLLMISACSSGATDANSESSEPIRIGGIFSLSGPASGVGSANLAGVEMAIEQINNNGGIDGRPIELLVEDDEGNPGKANTATTKLIQQKQVTAIIGPSITTTVLAASEIANANQTVLLAPTFTGAQVEGEYLFRIGLSDKHSVKRMVEMANKYEKIGLLVNVGASGQSVRDVAVEELKSIGKEAVSVESFEPLSPDVIPQLLKLQEQGVEAILIQSLPGDTATIVKGMNQIGYDAEIIGHVGFSDPTYRNTAQQEAEGTFLVDVYDPIKPEILEFKKEYFELFGGNEDELVYWGATTEGYDAVNILAQALKEADFDKKQLKAAMEEIKDFKVISGFEGASISYSPENHNGLGYEGAVGLIVENGKLVRAPLMSEE